MADTFRILHVIDSLGIGGGQTMLFELHQAIEKHYPEISQDVILLDRKKFNDAFIDGYGIKYHKVNHELVTKMVLDYKEPVLFLFHKLLCSKTETYKRIYPRVPVVVLNHTYTDSNIYNRIEPCNLVISVSKSMRELIRRRNPRLKHKYVYNGVNQERYLNVPASERLEEDKDVLLTGRINSLNAIKYSDRWMEWVLMTELPKKMVHEYIGGGMYMGKAKKIINRNKKRAINEIRMLDFVTNFEEKVARIKTWDLFLYEINQNEGVSMAMLEALACGVPVMCSSHYGNKEIIEDGVNGYVFDSKAEAKSILTDLCLNPQILMDLKESTQKHFAEKLDARFTADRYMELLRKVMDGEKTLPIIKPKRIDGNSQKAVLASFSKATETNQVRAKDMNNKFTILTSGRNNATYIDDWVKSILAQEYRPLEVVYVNDNSSDNTVEKLNQLQRAFESNDIGFKLINNPERCYCGTSYHIGLKEVTGGYFGVLDSDDMLEDDAVKYIVAQYLKNPDVTWIYTQFSINKRDMQFRRKGISRHPGAGNSLLDLGRRRKHAYSHWRTVCLNRFTRPDKIFPKKLRCSVDKYMGYRLEEFGQGAFVDRICYKYREGSGPKCISSSEPTKKVWQQITEEAGKRRKRYGLKAHPIEILKA